MIPRKDLVVCLLLLVIFINSTKCQSVEEMSKTLNEILGNIRSIRRPRNDENHTSLIWEEYKFDTGVGNREVVVVTNISLINAGIPENVSWQFLQTEETYLVCAENSTLLFYKINLNDLSIEYNISVKTEGRILLFRVMNLNVEENVSMERENRATDLMAVLLVESQCGYFLYWYRIFKNMYTLYLTLPVQKKIQDIEFIQERGQYELVLLDNTYIKGQSLMDIYEFSIDYINHRIDIRFCHRLYVPKVFDVKFCSIYGKAVLALQGIESVILYDSKNEDTLCQFEEFEVVKSNKLTNFVCFESGYIEYLAVAGEEARLLHFYENEFHDNVETDLRFNDTTEVFWVTAIPLSTYRDESLLLIQLRNSTVMALAWQGSKFTRVPLPNEIMNDLDLSKIVVVPKVGFVYGNMFVRIDVILEESVRSTHDGTENMLKTQALLKEIFLKQEATFDKMEMQLNQSYYKDPVIGFRNFSEVDVVNVTLGNDVNYHVVKIGSIDLSIEDILTNVTSSLKKLQELEAKLDQILPDLEGVTNGSLRRITLPPDVEITGDFVVNGTLHAKNVIVTFINNTSTSTVADGVTNRAADTVINGTKSFPSINTNNLTVFSLNGIPLEEIVFNVFINNYNDVDFSKLTRLEINGHLNFSEINGVAWENLMQNIVWKDKPANISGETIVETLVAEEVDIEYLNNLRYPQDYVLVSDRSPINVTGEKYFSNLSVTHLLDVNTINGIAIDDFIILNRHEVIDQEIIFEDLEVDGTLEIDGNITGINVSNIEDTLDKTNKLSSDVIFENLIILGNIVIQDSINDKTWSDFDDILLKTQEDAVITGNKRFLSGVNIMSSMTITSGLINNHEFAEFVTLDTDQQFPYLKKISAEVTFDNVTSGALKRLEDYITREQDANLGCMNKVILFMKSPIIDDLYFDTLKQTIPRDVFLDKLNRTFHTAHFEDLMLSSLTADEILPNTINGVWNYTDLARRALTVSTRQNLTGSWMVDNLETAVLDVGSVNGMSMSELNLLLKRARSYYNILNNSTITIESLRVTGTITASSINGRDIVEEENAMNVIFEKNVTIENLTVNGFVNGLNLSELIADAVQRTDKNITFVGRKTIENVTCRFLDVQFINGHSVNDLLDPDREQVLKGPVIINGSVTVLENFGTTGKIGNLSLHDLMDRFKPLGNNSYALRGNFRFTEEVTIEELNVNGTIQGIMFDSLLQTAISKNDTNVTISGAKLFKNDVTFLNPFIIDGNLNDIDLHKFRDKVVYIDMPFSIDSKVIFKEDIHVEKSLLVRQKLQSNTIMGVDLKELQENTIALDKPNSFLVRMTLSNATFQAGVEVEQINDLQMDRVIPLNTTQLIAERLHCINITVNNYEFFGRLNNQSLEEIYADTFMIYGNQHVKGNIKIHGNVYAYHDFNPRLINGFSPKQIISLITNDTLTGNFMFKDPIVLDESLRIIGLLNGINPISWQGTAVKIKDVGKQIISGKWRVHGDVHFRKNVDGNEFLNGFNVTEISTAIAKEYAEIYDIVRKTNETLNNICEDLNILKYNAENQIYKFNTFDYLKILEFDGSIHGVLHIEWDDLSYLLVNYGICYARLLLYTSNGLEEVDEISNFGLIGQWTVFNSNHTKYIFTVVKHVCGGSVNNIWKLENNRLTRALELGDTTDKMSLYQDMFVALIHENQEKSIIDNVRSNMLEALVSYKDERLNPIINSEPTTLANYSTHKLQERSSNGTYFLRNCLDCDILLNFKTGIFEKEEYIYYNKEISQDYIYICKNDSTQTKILQTIKAYRPSSFLILNFDGFIETLLIFVENNETIQIYEYRGIEGFVYSNIIKMKADKLYNFKMRKYANLKKRHHLTVVHENRLTVLEAKMYGERLDLEALDMDSC